MIPSHVSPADVIDVAVKLMRADAYRLAQQDARARQLKGKDAGLWADQKAAVYRYELTRGVEKIAEGEQ
jgi:hypothetical protein